MNDTEWDQHRGVLRQQTILARFGELALRSENLDEILTEACRLVGDALGTDLAKVMELQPGGETLLVRAGVGWKPGVVGEVTVEVADTSVRFDRLVKARLYARAGIAEFWLCLAMDGAIEVYRGPGADGYATWRIGRYADRELLPRRR